MLTEDGYTHYREKTTTEFGELAELVRQRDDGDFNNLIARAKGRHGKDTHAVRNAVRQGLSEIKGVGGVALDVFCDTAQGMWPHLAPFLEPRGLKMADEIGLSLSAM